MPQSHEAADKKLAEMEAEHRKSIKDSLERLEANMAEIRQQFVAMARDNDGQHTELKTIVLACDSRVEVLAAKYEAELKRTNDILLGKNKLIRALLISILFLMGVLAEAKLHLSSLFKLLGLGG